MKTYSLLTTLLLAGASLCASAHTFDPVSRLRLSQAQNHLSRSNGEYTGMIVEFDDPAVLDSLTAHGSVIYNVREPYALVCVPPEAVSYTMTAPAIRRASVSAMATPTLDKARPATRVDVVQAGGAGLPRAYDGSGVTVGFADIGFDPSHVAFSGRIASRGHYIQGEGYAFRSSDPAEIADYGPDDPYMFHATHVGGILCGYDPSTPYSGVATGANLVATTSSLYDIEILAGVEQVIAQAKAAGQPAVVNLSLGSTLGPHDGTDLFTRYLDLCADDAAILLASGNDGQNPVSAALDFDTDTPTNAIIVLNINESDMMHLSGIIDMWSYDSAPFDIRIAVWDIQKLDRVFTTDWVRPDTEPWTMNDQDEPRLAPCFEGALEASAEVSPLNGRFNTAIQYSLQSLENYPDKTFSLYTLVIEAKADPGTHIDVFAGGKSWLQSSGQAWWITHGNPDCSVSSMACGKNTICVGMSTTRSETPKLEGGTATWPGFTAGTVTAYSSYGHKHSGEALPHFCAPGAYIVSAVSSAYAKNTDYEDLAARSGADADSYYKAECGTSMATPHAAGIFALWLQADPTLRPADLRRIAIETARPDGVDLTDPRSGAGVIDALGGLQRILAGDAGNADLPADIVRIYRSGSSVVAEGAPAGSVVEVHTLAGQRISPDALPPSPVIVRLTTPSGTTVRKI